MVCYSSVSDRERAEYLEQFLARNQLPEGTTFKVREFINQIKTSLYVESLKFQNQGLALPTTQQMSGNFNHQNSYSPQNHPFGDPHSFFNSPGNSGLMNPSQTPQQNFQQQIHGYPVQNYPNYPQSIPFGSNPSLKQNTDAKNQPFDESSLKHFNSAIQRVEQKINPQQGLNSFLDDQGFGSQMLTTGPTFTNQNLTKSHFGSSPVDHFNLHPATSTYLQGNNSMMFRDPQNLRINHQSSNLSTTRSKTSHRSTKKWLARVWTLQEQEFSSTHSRQVRTP